MKEKLLQFISKLKNASRARVFLSILFVVMAGAVTLGVSQGVLAQADNTPAPAPSQQVPNSGTKNYSPTQNGDHNTITNPLNYLTSEFWISLAASILLYLAELGIKITLFLFTFIIQISAYNGYLDATAVTVGWVMMRDLTNMLFVIVLLLIAFGTILGLEQYEWKKMLVKFVMAAILVNFSRLICGILIDISQLVMTTFINGIVATAGGNLVNAFGLQKIIDLNTSAKPNELTSPGIFSAAFMALIFSLTTVYTIGIFVFILAKRLVTLWILIVLSPMAFVLTILPDTEGAAKKWWMELMDNLVTGPVILFFIWLSFVTVGQGQINTEIASSAETVIGSGQVIKEGVPIEADSLGRASFGVEQRAGVGDAMGWNQMASFIVAVGMLIAGAQVASEIGGSSGNALSGVAAFATKVGTIASGYVLGRSLFGTVGSAVGGASKAAAKFALLDMTPLRNWGTRISYGAQRIYNQAQMLRQLAPGTEMPVMRPDKDGNMKAVIDPTTGLPVTEKYNPTGWHKVASVLLRPNRINTLKKSEKELGRSKDMLEAVEKLRSSQVRAVPQGAFLPHALRGDGADAIFSGLAESYEERSASKKAKFNALGKVAGMQSNRVQYDPSNPAAGQNGMPKGWVNKGVIADEIEGHNLERGKFDAALQKIQAEAKVNVTLDGKNKRAPEFREMLRQTALLKEQAAASEAAAKTQEIKMANQALQEKEGIKALQERTEAEKGEHHEAEKEALIRKTAEEEFFRSAHGQAELEEAAIMAARTAALDASINKEKAEREKEAYAEMERQSQTFGVKSPMQIAAELEAARVAAEEEKKEVEAREKKQAADITTAEQARAERAKIGIAEAEGLAKEIAESVKAGVMGEAGMADKLRATQEAAIGAGLAAAQQKTAEEMAKAEAATGRERDIFETKAEEIRAAGYSAKQKKIEEKEKNAAMAMEAETVRQTEGAKIEAARFAAAQKTAEEAAKNLAMGDKDTELLETERELLEQEQLKNIQQRIDADNKLVAATTGSGPGLVSGIQAEKIAIDRAQTELATLNDNARNAIISAAQKKAQAVADEIAELEKQLMSQAEVDAQKAVDAASAKLNGLLSQFVPQAQQVRNKLIADSAKQVAEQNKIIQDLKPEELETSLRAEQAKDADFLKLSDKRQELLEERDKAAKTLEQAPGKKAKLLEEKEKLEKELATATASKKAGIKAKITAVDAQIADLDEVELQKKVTDLGQQLDVNEAAINTRNEVLVPNIAKLKDAKQRILEIQKERDKELKIINDDEGKQRVKANNESGYTEATRTLQAARTQRILEQEKDGTPAKIKKEDVDRQIAIKEKAAQADPVVAYVFAKQQAATAKAALDEVDNTLKETLLGFKAMQNLFKEEQARALGSEAAKQFADAIKQAKIGEIFKDAAKRFSTEVLEKVRKGESLEKIHIDPADVALRQARAQVMADYRKDMVGVSKREVADEAASALSLEFYGFETPSSAYEELVGKRMKDYSNVERERAVTMASGSLAKLIQISEAGGELTADQKAQMMANVKYLTSQAWSDDLLAAIGKKIEQKNKGLLKDAKDVAEATALEEIFAKQLGWAKYKSNGELDLEHFKNRSGADRTNDLHRLSAVGGSIETVTAENAVLRYAQNMKLDVDDAAQMLSSAVQNALKNDTKLEELVTKSRSKSLTDPTEINELNTKIGDIASSLGLSAETAGNELLSFTKKFVDTQKTSSEMMRAFVDDIKKHSQAYEMLTVFKKMALDNGHIDDGGHTVYDQKLKMSRGQLWDDALAWVLADWRKLEANQRVAKLKSHTIAHMDETTGTVTIPSHLREVIRETFSGVGTARIFERLDGRLVDHISGLSAGERAQIDKTSGAMIIGHKDSVVVSKDNDNDPLAALQQIANNWATMLADAPVAMAAALGQRSNMGFDRAVTGQFNIKIDDAAFSRLSSIQQKALEKALGGGRRITNAKQMLAFIKTVATSSVRNELQDRVVEKAFVNATRSNNSQAA